MVRMRQRAIIVAACTALLALIAAAPASAATADTFPAASVTATTATLHGFLNVTHADSAWAFQYGTTTQYGKLTPPQTVKTGSYEVSAQIKALSPGTAYHFRLVLYQVTTTDSAYNTGTDKSFQTPAASTGKRPGKKSPSFGTAKLSSHSLVVRKGTIAVRLHCSGKSGSRCRGSLTVRATGPRGRSIRCAGTSFSLNAGKSRTLHPHVSSGCVSLLSATRKHRVAATLLATFSTHQVSLSQPVTLHQ